MQDRKGKKRQKGLNISVGKVMGWGKGLIREGGLRTRDCFARKEFSSISKTTLDAVSKLSKEKRLNCIRDFSRLSLSYRQKQLGVCG